MKETKLSRRYLILKCKMRNKKQNAVEKHGNVLWTNFEKQWIQEWDKCYKFVFFFSVVIRL